MSDLAKELRIMAGMITMCERISFGSDSALMEKSATEIYRLESENAELKSQVEKLKERNRKLDVDLLRALFYAPSSPVSAQKAQEIEVWYGKFKQVVLATKAGE